MNAFQKMFSSNETKSEKRVRYFLAVMFFIQTFLTTMPYMHGLQGDKLATVSALQMVLGVVYNGFKPETTELFIYGLIFVLTPMVAFFFCILDNNSRVKYIFTAASAVLCAVFITFTIVRPYISLGAVITLILCVINLFMTVQGIQATSSRINGKSR